MPAILPDRRCVLREGSTGDNMFFIEKGVVKLQLRRLAVCSRICQTGSILARWLSTGVACVW